MEKLNNYRIVYTAGRKNKVLHMKAKSETEARTDVKTKYPNCFITSVEKMN